eukprot:7032820-Lingulodinium_polyedra.AAC.1
MASSAPPTWPGINRPNRIAPPCTPTWNPIWPAASSAEANTAGKTPRFGKTATASLQASGPHTGGAS